MKNHTKLVSIKHRRIRHRLQTRPTSLLGQIHWQHLWPSGTNSSVIYCRLLDIRRLATGWTAPTCFCVLMAMNNSEIITLSKVVTRLKIKICSFVHFSLKKSGSKRFDRLSYHATEPTVAPTTVSLCDQGTVHMTEKLTICCWARQGRVVWEPACHSWDSLDTCELPLTKPNIMAGKHN